MAVLALCAVLRFTPSRLSGSRPVGGAARLRPALLVRVADATSVAGARGYYSMCSLPAPEGRVGRQGSAGGAPPPACVRYASALGLRYARPRPAAPPTALCYALPRALQARALRIASGDACDKWHAELPPRRSGLLAETAALRRPAPDPRGRRFRLQFPLTPNDLRQFIIYVW